MKPTTLIKLPVLTAITILPCACTTTVVPPPQPEPTTTTVHRETRTSTSTLHPLEPTVTREQRTTVIRE